MFQSVYLTHGTWRPNEKQNICWLLIIVMCSALSQYSAFFPCHGKNLTLGTGWGTAKGSFALCECLRRSHGDQARSYSFTTHKRSGPQFANTWCFVTETQRAYLINYTFLSVSPRKISTVVFHFLDKAWIQMLPNHSCSLQSVSV